MSAAGAVIIRKQNQYINTFLQQGAVDAAHAIQPESVGVPTNYIFIRLSNRGIFVPCGNGTYYLDVKAAAFFREARHKRAMMILVLTLILLLFYFYIGVR